MELRWGCAAAAAAASACHIDIDVRDLLLVLNDKHLCKLRLAMFDETALQSLLVV
jgi:hypothetical protein